MSPSSTGGLLIDVRIAVASAPDGETVRFILDVPREPYNMGRLSGIVSMVKSKTNAMAEVRIMVHDKEAPRP